MISMAKKKFAGSLAVLIILIVCCWPAAIIYFIMKEDELESEDDVCSRTCLRCGARYPMNYLVCPYCGQDWMIFNRGTAANPGFQSGPTPSNAPGAQFCNQCGATLIPGGSFCNRCGRPPQQ